MEEKRLAKEVCEQLIQAAYEAKKMSYAPYSNFHVGAALLGKSGRIYPGCNIENAAYTPTNCAERTAVFRAVSDGEREFTAIAVAGDGDDYLAPCGVCRQVLQEFAEPEEFIVLMAGKGMDYRAMTLAELFPASFSKADLEK
ncbi:MAG: cytidine deaminase [Lachnospiraceae bacterium]|nr:cytidine deaminase [Lachnospiraceae bacterium]